MPKRMATCHPDRPHYAFGLCASCYQKKKISENRELAERVKEKSRARYLKNREDPEWVERKRLRGREYARRRREDGRQRDYHLRREYGISLEEYDNMLDTQDNGCAVCGRTPEENGKRLAVDHDHETGEVRSLLCHNCNAVLGLVKDDPEMLERLAEYLRFWNNTN